MFYDEIADYYDQMIPFDSRVTDLERQLRDLVYDYGIKTALDAGAASGATCIALARLGVRPTGIEYSHKMIVKARQNCRLRNLQIPFKEGDLRERQTEFRGKFEGIFCLANTLSHFLNESALSRVLSNFRSWLAPGGVLIIQLLNYRRIMRERERIVKIYNNKDRVFIRFYDFAKERINFNLLTVEKRPGICDYSLHTIPLRGWTSRELGTALKASKFRGLKMRADFKGRNFHSSEASDLVIICRRP